MIAAIFLLMHSGHYAPHAPAPFPWVPGLLLAVLMLPLTCPQLTFAVWFTIRNAIKAKPC